MQEEDRMTQPYKPEGRSDVSVYVMADAPEPVIGFMTAVLGAEEIMKLTRPDGSLMHGEYRIGDSVVMIAQAAEAHPAFPVWLHVYVPDVGSAWRKALDFGVEPVEAPKRGEDGDRRGAVRDAAGNIWWLATSEA